jgi:aromatic ring-opening dioxygenase catalytic subunit (LigB family)
MIAASAKDPAELSARKLNPVHFFSHGSTAMLGESSKSADYWEACGKAALENGIKHVVIMVSIRYVMDESPLTALGCTLGHNQR